MIPEDETSSTNDEYIFPISSSTWIDENGNDQTERTEWLDETGNSTITNNTWTDENGNEQWTQTTTVNGTVIDVSGTTDE